MSRRPLTQGIAAGVLLYLGCVGLMVQQVAAWAELLSPLWWVLSLSGVALFCDAVRRTLEDE